MASSSGSDRNLVGRRLVPFFADGEDGTAAAMAAQEDFAEGAEEIVVRKWNKESGVFEDPQRLGASAPRSKKKKKKKPKKNGGASQQQEQQDQQQVPLEKFALPAFLCSPEPAALPIPRFLDVERYRAGGAERKRPRRRVEPAAAPAEPAEPAPREDVIAPDDADDSPEPNEAVGPEMDDILCLTEGGLDDEFNDSWSEAAGRATEDA